ncbi:MAG: response regulator transcription factor [Planctomycetes bacterium]|nr:response regulator transcription factor [Planctomycetota bacterium]
MADLLQADLGTQSRVEAVEQLEQMPARASKSKPVVIVLGRDSLLWLPRWRHVGLSAPVMVLLPPGSTGHERARCLDAGADECLNRPLDAQELRARLSVLSRRGRWKPGAVCRVHDLEVDFAARTVRRNGVPISLTPREFDLLRLLADRRGEVVSRAALRRHLYGDHVNNHSNVVDVYIRYLRSKIDEGFSLPLILTRRGEGYFLRADEE